MRRLIPLLALLAFTVSHAAPVTGGYQWKLPRGFPVPAVPADNPMSEVKVALGQRLFFEKQLSVTGDHSCASCHDPARAFADDRPVAVGATGQALPHNAMALVNVAYNLSYGWTNPHLDTLEAQMREPLFNEHPVELGMRGREREVTALLQRDATYRTEFAAAFPESDQPVDTDNMIKAIAAFQRTLISGYSRFDRYVFDGDHDALPANAKRGMEVFYGSEAGCANCHSGFNFSGMWRDARGATGEPGFARNGTSRDDLKIPTLRNIVLTAPYMHDGRYRTLEAVIDHYGKMGKQGLPLLGRMRLTEQEKSDLISFLQSLTDEEFVERYRFH